MKSFVCLVLVAKLSLTLAGTFRPPWTIPKVEDETADEFPGQWRLLSMCIAAAAYRDAETLYEGPGDWRLVYHEEERHTEAVEAARNYYMKENEVNCENLRAKSFRLREEKDEDGVFNYWFVLEVIDPCNGKAPICSFRVTEANEVLNMDCHQLDRLNQLTKEFMRCL